MRLRSGHDPRAEAVRLPCRAESDPVVGSALSVGDHAAIVGEARPVREADVVEDCIRQRLGGDHPRIDGQDVPPQALQISGVRLGGAHDHRGPNFAAAAAHRRATSALCGNLHCAAVESGDTCLLVDLHPRRFGGAGQSQRQLGGIHYRRRAEQDTAAHIGGVELLACFVSIEQADLVFGQPEAASFGYLGDLPLRLGTRARHPDGAALGVVAVDALSGCHTPDLVDCVEHGSHQAPGFGRAGAPRVVGNRSGQLPHGPAAVAPRRPEAAVVPLQHGHTHRGLELLEVVGGPQTAEAAAHDGDVDVEITLDSGTGRDRRLEPVDPQRRRRRRLERPRIRAKCSGHLLRKLLLLPAAPRRRDNLSAGD